MNSIRIIFSAAADSMWCFWTRDQVADYIKGLDLLPADFDWSLSAETICDAAVEQGLDLNMAAEEIARDSDGVAGPHADNFRVIGPTVGTKGQIKIVSEPEYDVDPKGRTAIYWVDHDGPTYSLDIPTETSLDFAKLKLFTTTGYDCKDVVTYADYDGDIFFLESDEREGTSSVSGWDFFDEGP